MAIKSILSIICHLKYYYESILYSPILPPIFLNGIISLKSLLSEDEFRYENRSWYSPFRYKQCHGISTLDEATMPARWCKLKARLLCIPCKQSATRVF